MSTESRKGQEKKRRSKAEVVRQEEVLGVSSVSRRKEVRS